MDRIISFFKTYPLPVCVLIAILAGASFYIAESMWAHWIWFVTLIFGGTPIVFETIKGMIRGKFASDIVAMLAIITAVILDEAFAGAVVVLMQSGGEAIEKYGLRRATSSLEELLKREPRKARRKKETTEEIDVEDVLVGDILVVRPGEMIPVDGTIVSGKTQVDESAVTGEPLDKEKVEGSFLLSGSINVSGAIEMRADKRSVESQYAKIVQLVQKAQEERAPIQRLADRYAILFTPLALAMATLGVIITEEFVSALAVLVVATPCPLILATPLAIICGINQSAREGIIVKGGAALEQIGKAKGVLFDKTGTLTLGIPEVKETVSFGKYTTDEILLKAASIEHLSSHLIAKAIAQKALSKVKTLSQVENFEEIPGRSAKGFIDGDEYILGSHLLAKEVLGEDPPKLTSQYEKNTNPVYVIKNRTCIGAILLTDQMRSGVPSIMNDLKSLGIEKIMMVTGDSYDAAKTIASQANIQEFSAELFPQAKVDIVKQTKKQYSPLVMVGDGINDAPALATADIGIAMGAHGTAISAEAANIVLLVDELSAVVGAIKIGQRTLFIAKQSIFIGIGLSFVLMIFAACGKISPPFGALFQEIIDVAVILNAIRVLKK